jgi:hypothetical protein
MLVHLHQYKHESVDFDDNRTAGESQTEDSVDKDTSEYFAQRDLDAEEWETVEYENDPIQRRSITVGEVTAVSVPQEPAESDDPDLPGLTIQLRLAGGDTEYVGQTEIVEVQDEQPQ